MIPRYKVPEIHEIWKTKNKLNTWLKVEIAHLESLKNNITDKTISEDEYYDILHNVTLNIDRWKEIESETKHDVQAFVQMLEETVPNNSGRWIHYGLTSSDILDTSLTLLCRETLQVVIDYCSSTLYYLNILLKREETSSLILSRTHGKAAEKQTYRDVILRWTSYLRNSYDELLRVKSVMNKGKLSGAVGNNTYNSYQNETNALRSLGLYPIKSSQIIPRYYYLDYFYALLKVNIAVEKIAYDIRIYSIDGINEMSEPFSKKQKGSSAMPHKKNPILTENICGLTRLYKSYMQTAIENCSSLLERDISHSSSERIIFKDGAHITCFCLKRLEEVIKGLNLNIDSAKQNLDIYMNDIHSQEKLKNFIHLGMSRKDSHDKVQKTNNKI